MWILKQIASLRVNAALPSIELSEIARNLVACLSEALIEASYIVEFCFSAEYLSCSAAGRVRGQSGGVYAQCATSATTSASSPPRLTSFTQPKPTSSSQF